MESIIKQKDSISNEKYNPNLCFIMMVGISGSGKSTYAKKICDEANQKGNKMCILSSDALRHKICGSEEVQDKNNIIFSEMNKRCIQALLEGISVIYDATNLSVKDRSKILNKLNEFCVSCTRIAYIMTTPIHICFDQNNSRCRIVPYDVIGAQLQKFQIPVKGEGFDDIVFSDYNLNYSKSDDNVFRKLINKYDIINCYEFTWTKCFDKIKYMYDQCNFHHDFTLGKHSDLVQQKIEKASDFFCRLRNCDEKYNLVDKNILSVAAKYHDIGKLLTRKIKEDGIASYFGHANVGTYMLMTGDFFDIGLHIYSYTNLDNIVSCGVDMNELLEVLTLINYHMYAFQLSDKNISEKTVLKYKKLLGEKMYNSLMILHQADVASCKKKEN